jgi:polyphosphate kinase
VTAVRAASPRRTSRRRAPAGLPFLNRELSWLDFNERVLHEARDQRTPLLERAKFLAIFASNLDEFFMVRVAGLKRRIATGIAVRAASGLMPRDVLEGIYGRSAELMHRQATLFHSEIQPALEAQDIHLLRWEEASTAERDQLS